MNEIQVSETTRADLETMKLMAVKELEATGNETAETEEEELSTVDQFVQRALNEDHSDLIVDFDRLSREEQDEIADVLYIKYHSGETAKSHLICHHRCVHVGVLSSQRLSVLRSFWSNFEDSDDWDDTRTMLEDDFDVIYCDDCGEAEFNDNTREPVYSRDDVCRSCIEESYRWSDYYDNYVHRESTRWALDSEGLEVLIHEDDDDFSWSDEADQYVHHEYEPPGPVIIGNYHESKRRVQVRPSPWTKLKNRYMGVELEVEVVGDGDRGEKAEELHRLINGEEIGKNVFFERDGSLNNGFEIITHPMGMDDHRKIWEWLKDRKATRYLRSHQTQTCGLHVHISKGALTKLQIAKIVTFINNRDHESLIKAVARRYETGYCKIKNKKIGQSHYSEDRYEAINITPRNTIEFRIFKGSLKYESVMAAIQFSNAVVEFCDPSRTSVRDLTMDNFLRFIKEDISEDTDILVPYLDNRLELA